MKHKFINTAIFVITYILRINLSKLIRGPIILIANNSNSMKYYYKPSAHKNQEMDDYVTRVTRENLQIEPSHVK